MPIRTFHPRRGRISGRHMQAMRRLWPRFGLEITGEPGSIMDPVTVFGRKAPLVLEIGSGMGEATAAMAQADPDRDYLAVEVYVPGVANLLALAEDLGLGNIRVGYGDALDLLRYRLAPRALDAIHIFFPDPWPKVRHHKRRLIQPEHVALLSSRLRPGGMIHCATDWMEYAQVMLKIMTDCPDLVNMYKGFAPRLSERPVTRFEQQGIDAGRQIVDLFFIHHGDC